MSVARRGTALLAIAVLAVSAPSALAGPRGVVRDLPPPRGLEAAYAPRRVALVVGIDQYTDPALGPLKYAAKDARDLGDVLSDPRYGGYDVVSVLAGNVTRAGFWSALNAVTAHLQRDDTFVLYVASHGTVDLSALGTSLFLLPSDAWLEDAERTGILVAEVASYVEALPARRRVTIYDACHTVGDRAALSPRTLTILGNLRGPVPAPAALEVSELEAHLYAARVNQPAMEDDALQNGVYSHFLIEALTGAGDMDGDGLVEVAEAHNWARDRTLEYTGGAQVPWAETTAVGREAIYLSGDPTRRRRAEHAIVVGLEALPADAVLSVDGVPRGGGPIEPGRRLVQVEAGGVRLAEARISVAEGQRINLGAVVEHHMPHIYVAVGPSINVVSSVLPPGGATLRLEWEPRDPSGGRPVAMVDVSGAFGSIPVVEGAFPGGTLLVGGRWQWGGALGAGPGLAVGPAIEGGLLWRVPQAPAGTAEDPWSTTLPAPQAAPLLAPGLDLHLDVGRTRFSLEPRLLWFPFEGAPSVGARVDATVGLRL